MLQHWYVNVMLCLIVVVMLLWLSLSHDRVDDQKHISNHDRTIRRLRAMHHEFAFHKFFLVLFQHRSSENVTQMNSSFNFVFLANSC
uniref:Uncharacterized protein n=1 Tax=Glycine max TaxID=3847 RepID=K7M381_SOYBN